MDKDTNPPVYIANHGGTYETVEQSIVNENTQLKERVAELLRYHDNGRMNVWFDDADESLQVCRGHHPAHEGCTWEVYVTEKSVTNRIVRALQSTIERVKEVRDN